MTDDQLTLRDIALKASARFGGVRGRALGREAEKAGVKIVYTTIDDIISGRYRSVPKAATLEALAELAGVPVETVYKAAELPIPQAPFAEQLPDDVDTLTPPQRDVVLAVIRQFAASNRTLHGVRNRLAHGDAAGALIALVPPPPDWDQIRLEGDEAEERLDDEQLAALEEDVDPIEEAIETERST